MGGGVNVLSTEARLRKLFELRDRIDAEIAQLCKGKRQRRHKDDLPPCGTETGYQRHRYRGEECEPCRAAHAAHNRARYRERKAS